MPPINPRPIPTRGCIRRPAGAEAKLSYLGHVLMENRNGLLVRTTVTPADGTAERDAALLVMVDGVAVPDARRITLGGDKNYDTHDFVADAARRCAITPHVAQNDTTGRRARLTDARRAIAGYAISQQKRKRVEQCSAG